MRTSCEERKCQFWNGKNCTDKIDFINAKNGDFCCRYHPDAIIRDNEDIDDILPSECEECGYRLSAIENTPKEITVNYLKSIKKDLENISGASNLIGKSIMISRDIEAINKAIKLVEESEGE